MSARELGWLLLVNGLLFGAGAGVTRLLGAWRTPAGLLRRLGVVYLGGVAAAGVAFQTLLVLGVPFERLTVIATCAALGLTGFVGRFAIDSPRLMGSLPRSLWPIPGAVLAMVALLAIDLWFQPLGVWDAWAQWTAKGKAIAIFHDLDLRLFASEAYRAWNPDYPVLVPAVEAATFVFSGNPGSRVAHYQFLLLYGGFLLAVWQLARERVQPLFAWLLALVLAVVPTLQLQVASALADVPVGVFFALAGIFAWRWLVDLDSHALPLLALFSAGALAAKFEGRIYIVALFLGLIGVALVLRRSVKGPLLAAAAAFATLLPWVVWTRHHDVRGIFPTSLRGALGSDLLEHLGRLPLIVGTFTWRLLDPTAWLLVVPLIVVVVVVAWRTGRSRADLWFLVAVLTLAFLGLMAVYWVTPLDVHWHLRQSARRVIVGPVLFALVLLPYLVARLPRASRDPIERS